VVDLEESHGSCSNFFLEVLLLVDTLCDASHVLSEKEKWSDSCAIVGIQDNRVASRAVAEDDSGMSHPCRMALGQKIYLQVAVHQI
jgi:hypothetical protein